MSENLLVFTPRVRSPLSCSIDVSDDFGKIAVVEGRSTKGSEDVEKNK